MERSAIVYHCWFEPSEPEPCENVRTPVVVSSSTLRASSSIPVIVLDLSDEERDWGVFPKRLGFKVARRDPFYRSVRDRVRGWKHLSRIPDIHHWAEENGVSHLWYADTDTFWLRSPQSTSKSFCFDGFNSGFYYYSPGACEDFIKLFKAYAWAAIHSESVRAVLKKSCAYDGWYGVWDEMILGHMLRENAELVKRCEAHEHITCSSVNRETFGPAVLLHANSASLRNPFPRMGGQEEHSPGVFALAIKEVYQRLTFAPHELSQVFNQQELSYFLPRQFSLEEVIDLLPSARRAGQPWHVELDRFLNHRASAAPMQTEWLEPPRRKVGALHSWNQS